MLKFIVSCLLSILLVLNSSSFALAKGSSGGHSSGGHSSSSHSSSSSRSSGGSFKSGSFSSSTTKSSTSSTTTKSSTSSTTTKSSSTGTKSSWFSSSKSSSGSSSTTKSGWFSSTKKSTAINTTPAKPSSSITSNKTVIVNKNVTVNNWRQSVPPNVTVNHYYDSGSSFYTHFWIYNAMHTHDYRPYGTVAVYDHGNVAVTSYNAWPDILAFLGFLIVLGTLLYIFRKKKNRDKAKELGDKLKPKVIKAKDSIKEKILKLIAKLRRK